MSRLINRSSNANLTKANIQRLAQKDLAKLELARRQTNLINNERQHKTNKVPVCPEKPASSSDSGDESDRPAKRPRLSLAQDDSPTDVVFIREVDWEAYESSLVLGFKFYYEHNNNFDSSAW